MGVFRHPLPRVLAVAIALFAALSFALPALTSLAVPPNNGPIDGTATAVPQGSCAGNDTQHFAVTVSIQDGSLYITDPADGAWGPINADGTAHLAGPQETYDLLSFHETVLNLKETYGCPYLTTIVLDRVLFPAPTVPPSTQVGATAAQPTVSGTPGVVAVPTSGGRSLTWLWGAGIVAGAGVLGGGLYLLRRQVIVIDAPDDCSDELEAVRRALREVQPWLEAEDEFAAQNEALAGLADATNTPASDFERAEAEVKQATQHLRGTQEALSVELEELDEALAALADCLGEIYVEGTLDKPYQEGNNPTAAALRNVLKRLGVPPEKPRFTPVPPPAGDTPEGDERQEIG